MITVIITAKEVVEGASAIRAVFGEEKNGLPAKVAFRLGRVLRVLTTEAEELSKQQQRLQRKYWKVDDEGNPTLSKNGVVLYTDREGYEDELDGLMRSKVEVRIDGRIGLGDLGKKFKVGAAHACALEAAEVIDSGLASEDEDEGKEDE